MSLTAGQLAGQVLKARAEMQNGNAQTYFQDSSYVSLTKASHMAESRAIVRWSYKGLEQRVCIEEEVKN
jgi:hypothetical protein